MNSNTTKHYGKEDNSSEESDESDYSESDEDEDEEDVTWIEWFCSIKGNEFFAKVDEDYIRDDFNLTGLQNQVPFYESAMEIILDGQLSETMTKQQQEEYSSSAETLFGLIHARYILTVNGLASMKEKYASADFGRCPRAFCEGFPLLPVGQSDLPCQSTVKLYCSRCEDIYAPSTPKHSKIDGSYFSTSFPHIFLLNYPELKGSEPTQRYVPRIFGFKLHDTCQLFKSETGVTNNSNSNNTNNTNEKIRNPNGK
eukprot:c13144_g1_i1.p1 GENE.c13144_g1_i1~~c13144_g1_i1.p1  ORF type:complete len:255 (+),score=81.49 c13144_g1_i1:176-940(+)